MGLFSSSKKTVVGTSVLRVVEDKNLPDTLKKSLVQAVIKNRNIPDTFMENILNGGVLQVEAMYRYAKENYHYGLPQSTVVSNQAGFQTVEGIIEQEVGQQIAIRYMEFLPLSNTHVAWKILTEQYGYDHATNEITSLSASTGTPVYLHNLVSIHTQELVDEADEAALRDLGPVGRSGFTHARPTNINPEIQALTMPTSYEIGLEEGVRVETVATPPGPGQMAVFDSFFISVSGYDLEPEYYQCAYTYQDATNTKIYGYWLYAFDSGIYPTLDEGFDPNQNNIGTYFPFVFFRNKKQDLTADSETATNAYKTSERLVDFLGMDFAEVGKEINENPDIGDVEQAYMMMGISANSTEQIDLKYLYEFFNRLRGQTVYDPEADHSRPNYRYEYNRDITNPNMLMISDTHSAMRFSYYKIGQRLVGGKIGAPGEYGTREGSRTFTRTVVYGPGQGLYRNVEITVPQRIYQKQITESTYEELTVTNPKMMYDIYKRYSHTAVVGEEQLLMPLDKTITDTFSLVEKEQIYARSMHFVFNSRVTEKVKWYESSFFKFILTVVAVVITVLSLGSAWQTLTLAAGTGATALAMTLATMLVEGAVYSYAFELVVQELGLENSLIGAVLATVAAFYIGAKKGGIDNAPWAEDLLAVSNGLLSGIGTETERQLDELQSDAQAFALLKEEAAEELEEANQLLEVETLLDPLSFVGLQPQIVPDEKPKDYYQRTIHQGNIGTLGFDAITSYVNYSLTLPELNDTIGD